MNYRTALVEADDGSLWLRIRQAGRRRVCGVAEACRRLRRTRRQVYRYIGEGVLKPQAKLLGEWLLDHEEVERLARRPLAVWPVPSRLQLLFPEYRIRDINAGRDAMLVISRVLEGGSRRDVSWLLRRYSKEEIRQFISDHGARLLSPRSLRLWSLYFRAAPKAPPSWRTQANPWLDRSGM